LSIESVINLPKQSISVLKERIFNKFPLLRPIEKKRPLMTTLQYEAIFPFVAHDLYQWLNANEYTHILEHYEDEANRFKLNGFFLLNKGTLEGHYFLFTYEGTWLYNNEPLNTPTHIQERINQLVCGSYECLIYKKSLIKENLFMDNFERLQMEIAGIELPANELMIYLEESGLDGNAVYNASSKVAKRAIYETALSILHSIANQPHLMKNYKQDDMTVSDFAKYLQKRIDQLELKIRQMPNTDSTPSNFFNLFQ